MNGAEVILEDVSKFYGEVLGVNRVSLHIPPGITSLVGPNGSGKTTLMNLMAGLIHPDRGSIRVRGISPRDPERLMRITGYATQYDAAPRSMTGFEFISSLLALHGQIHGPAPSPAVPLVVYGEACRLGAARLAQANVVFKHIPYDVKAR